jgi:hypothetical protein
MIAIRVPVSSTKHTRHLLLTHLLIVPLVSVDENLCLYFTAENTEIAEFSLFHFKFSTLSACPAFSLGPVPSRFRDRDLSGQGQVSGACSAVQLT